MTHEPLALRQVRLPGGTSVNIPAEHYEKMVAAGTVLPDQEQQDHRSGCPVQRTGKCLCDYLAQWDARADKDALAAEGRLGHKYTCFDAGTCCCSSTTDTICNHPGRGWHRDDNVSCQNWDAEVDAARVFGKEVIRNGYGHSNDSRYSDAEYAKIDPTPLRAFTEQMEAEGRVITLDALPDTSEWDGVFKQPGGLTGPGIMIIPDDLWDDFDPAKVLPGSPEFISASEYQARQQEQGPTPFQSHLTNIETSQPLSPQDSLILAATPGLQPAPFPLKEKDYYPTIEKDITALTVNGEIWEPRALRLGNEAAMEHWKKLALGNRRSFYTMFALSLAGWTLALARGIWGF